MVCFSVKINQLVDQADCRPSGLSTNWTGRPTGLVDQLDWSTNWTGRPTGLVDQLDWSTNWTGRPSWTGRPTGLVDQLDWSTNWTGRPSGLSTKRTVDQADCRPSGLSTKRTVEQSGLSTRTRAEDGRICSSYLVFGLQGYWHKHTSKYHSTNIYHKTDINTHQNKPFRVLIQLNHSQSAIILSEGKLCCSFPCTQFTHNFWNNDLVELLLVPDAVKVSFSFHKCDDWLSTFQSFKRCGIFT